MTLARVRRLTWAARPAAWKASPSTYTPPWKYRTTWRGSIPSTVISAVGTPPSAAAVTVTSAGSGCADVNSLSRRLSSPTSRSAGKADCRRIASRFSRCSVLTEDLPWVGLAGQRSQPGRPAGYEASPDHGDSRDRTSRPPALRSGAQPLTPSMRSRSLAFTVVGPAREMVWAHPEEKGACTHGRHQSIRAADPTHPRPERDRTPGAVAVHGDHPPR